MPYINGIGYEMGTPVTIKNRIGRSDHMDGLAETLLVEVASCMGVEINDFDDYAIIKETVWHAMCILAKNQLPVVFLDHEYDPWTPSFEDDLSLDDITNWNNLLQHQPPEEVQDETI